MYLTTTTDGCARCALCGPYGSCNIDSSPACGCLAGFQPRNPQQWDSADWSRGCTSNRLDCGSGVGFRKYSDVKLPDTRRSWYNRSMTLQECKTMCKNNCSCTAYSNLDISGSRSGCLLWFDDLVDIREFSDEGDDIYIRMVASELEKNSGSGSKTRVLLIAVIVLILITGVSLGLRYVFKRRKLKRIGILGGDVKAGYSNEGQNKNMELPLLSLSTILEATNNFSIHHKLGEGGFGAIYKGKLLTGQEVAVKRLSNSSHQGLQEFKNEILLIFNLQHRNLVKIVVVLKEMREC